MTAASFVFSTASSCDVSTFSKSAMKSSHSFAPLNRTPSFSHSMRRALHLARNSSRVIGHLDGCWLGSDLGFNELELTLTLSASTRDKRTTRSRGSCTFGKSLIQKRVVALDQESPGSIPGGAISSGARAGGSVPLPGGA